MSKERHVSNEIHLIELDNLRGAEYNPRKMVPERLEQVCNSLKYLGFVLPLYATPDGKLLSGHQRSRAARQLGYTKVPIVFLDVREDHEKGLNLVFNKATNDMDGLKTAKEVYQEFIDTADGLLSKMTEIKPDTYYPCMEARKAPVKELLSGIDEVSKYMFTSCSRMVEKQIMMPIVVCEGKVVNGKGRLYTAAHYGHTHVDVIDIKPEQIDYAHFVLNMLAMDFDMQEHFKEELRYNAYRRRSVSSGMIGFSRTFSYFVFGRNVANGQGQDQLTGSTKNLDDLKLLPHLDPEVKAKYQAVFGKNVVDFGCGLYHDTALMEMGGFNMFPFEPYSMKPDESQPDSEYSRQKAAEFLAKLEGAVDEGMDSVVSSYALNSIPHHKDRMAVLCILAALCRLKTTCYLGTQRADGRGAGMSQYLNPGMEPNMYLGHDLKSFKAQKYFYADELKKMCSMFWADVTITHKEATLYAKCKAPKRVNVGLLKEALELEYNLPYSDGTRMGMVERAKEVFGKYIGKQIP